MEKLKPVKSNENFKLLKNNVLYFDDHYLGTYADCAIDFYSKGVLITWQSPFNERLKDYLFYNNQGRLIFLPLLITRIHIQALVQNDMI